MDRYRNAPRLRNRVKIPGQWAVMFAKLDYSFYEACMGIEMAGPMVHLGTPAKLLEQDRLLSLEEVRRDAESVLLAHNVPAAYWCNGHDDGCRGR